MSVLSGIVRPATSIIAPYTPPRTFVTDGGVYACREAYRGWWNSTDGVAMNVGQAGTGKYQGYTWDGRHWVDADGQRGRFDPWQRTHWGWRALFVALAAVLIVSLVWPFVA